MAARAQVDERAFQTRAEFGRQIYNLLARRYPRAAGLSSTEFLAHVYPLLSRLDDLRESVWSDPGPIPFVIVVKSDLAPAAQAIRRVERRGQRAKSVLDADDLDRFEPIDGLRLPDGPAYLMVDVDTGADTRNVSPGGALGVINERGRSPLTIDEGIALLTHHPEAVAKNAGFSLLGSRCGDRRVTAMWLSQGRPKLGWCWAGNPHTWLGSASCAARLA